MSPPSKTANNAGNVRDALRAAILRGEFSPRQRLIETELMERYSASRFAIRNALLQLTGDGLVEMQPNRGARVREISVDEALEITEIRESLESLVAARAARFASEDDRLELTALAKSMTAAVADNELLRYSDLNATLHGRLREIARHATATKILEQMNGQMVRHQFVLSLLPGRPSTSLPEHVAIIDAVVAGDSDRAGEAMRAHIGSVMRQLSSLADADVSSLRRPQPSY